jgi:S-adenosylmethionine synthetase
MTKHFFSSESVTEGHPDKVCDQISDGIYDEMLKQDKDAHAGIECFCTTGLVVVGGEARTKAYIDIQKTVREVLKKIGYNTPDTGFNAEDVGVVVTLHEQSRDIAQGVDETSEKEQGAGDQGLMFGYACNETPELMPLPISLAHKLTKRLAEVRKSGELSYLLPDGKSQVTVEYENGKPLRVEAIVIASHHTANVELDKLRSDIKEKVILPVVGNLVDENTKFFINGTGRFVLGGPQADAGLTGRKIIVDTYGGMGAHGGGAMSGKCVTKVDRSGAYMARYVAKNIVASGLAEKCEVQVAYCIGIAQPVSVMVNTHGTGKISDDKISEIVKKIFDFRPKQIIDKLDLKKPVYLKTAAYGHFGRNDPDFGWEQTDKADELKKAAGVD